MKIGIWDAPPILDMPIILEGDPEKSRCLYIYTTRLDRVFVDARAQTWQHVASMEDRCRQCLPPQGDPRALACAPTYDLGDLGILYEFWERSTVLLNLRINKDLELVLIHFLGVKNVRHLPCGFEFSGFKFPESSIYVYGGKQIELRLQQ